MNTSAESNKESETSSARKISHLLKPSRIVPHTRWTATGRWAVTPLNFLILVVGLSIFGLGDSFIIQSHIGNAPWSVLAQGLSLHTPLSIGEATLVIGVLVLLLWFPLGQRPGFGTIANIIVISASLQLGLYIFPVAPKNLIAQLAYVLFGIALVGAGTALYITCGLGPGPRDGMMTALHKRTGIRVGRVRLFIEICALIVGAALGGRVGLGTALFALLIGNSMAIFLTVVNRAVGTTK
jgi:uncharacterized membrane protein YczE